MKLEEAASILGISLEDITIDGLKQAYKKLTLNWDPEKCKDQASRNKYQQISEAYRKLNFVVEGSEGYKGDDSHEIAAFMRMFMDMVGISENDNIPAAAAAMSFGMMFGSRSDGMDEWSTDDDDDDEDDDEDEEDDDEDFDDNMIDVEIEADDHDEYCKHKNHISSLPPPPSSSSNNTNNNSNINTSTNTMKTKTQVSDSTWEAPAKQYSNMNLKDEIMNNHKLVSSFHQSNQQEQEEVVEEERDDDDEDESDHNDEIIVVDTNNETTIDNEKKLKLAKKRSEKRKKQKEKKQKETINPAAQLEQQHLLQYRITNNIIAYDISKGDNEKVDVNVNIEKEKTKLLMQKLLETAKDNPADLSKFVQLSTKEIISELSTSISNGQLGKVNQILSYHFSDDIPSFMTEYVVKFLKKQLPSKPLLHHCVSNLAKIDQLALTTNTNDASTKAQCSPVSNNHMSSTTYNTAMTATLTARRLEVAKYLLNFRNPPLDLSAVDHTGLSALHLAINYGDIKVAQLIIHAFTEGSTERKSQLNINSRCHRQGWAPLHYAVHRCDVESVRLLIQLQGNVSVTMATDKRYTPLEFARSKLKSVTTSSVLINYTMIINELLKAIEIHKNMKDVDKGKKPSESSNRGANNTTSTCNISSTSSIQDILKELEGSSPAAVETKSSKKKKSDKKKGDKTDTSVATTTTTNSTSTSSNTSSSLNNASKAVTVSTNTSLLSANTSSSSTKTLSNEKNKTNSINNKQQQPSVSVGNNKNTTASSTKPSSCLSTVVNTTATTTSNKYSSNQLAKEMSIASRDELVDRLLGMGFREADCLVAISLYGTDIDQAISWLCDRPPPPALSSKESSKSKTTSESVSNNNNNKANQSHSSTTNTPISSYKAIVFPPGVSATHTSGSEATTTTTTSHHSSSSNQAVESLSSKNTLIANAAKMQKEKEELRRINRAWNAKAEDEKRKLEAQRKQLEIQKQEEEAILKQQQQQDLLHQEQLLQQQQQYYYQQQYIQQQMHSQEQHENYYTPLDQEMSVDNGIVFPINSIMDTPSSASYNKRSNYHHHNTSTSTNHLRTDSNTSFSTNTTTIATATSSSKEVISPSSSAFSSPYLVRNSIGFSSTTTSPLDAITAKAQLNNNSNRSSNNSSTNSSSITNNHIYNQFNNSSAHLMTNNDMHSLTSLSSESWNYSSNDQFNPYLDNSNNINTMNQHIIPGMKSNETLHYENKFTPIKSHSSIIGNNATNTSTTNISSVSSLHTSGAIGTVVNTEEVLVDGALELSAGAKEFVPRFHLNKPQSPNTTTSNINNHNNTSNNCNNSNNNNVLSRLHTNLSNFITTTTLPATSSSVEHSNLYSSRINPLIPSISSDINTINTISSNHNHNNNNNTIIDPPISSSNLLIHEVLHTYNNTSSSSSSSSLNNNPWDRNNLNLTSLQADNHTYDSIIPPLSLNNFYQNNIINNNTHISNHMNLNSNINISPILNDNIINNINQFDSDDDDSNNILSSIDNFLLNDN